MSNHVKSSKRISFTFVFIFLIILIGTIIIVLFPTQDTPHKSKVDGISDDVYYQLVEFYFHEITFFEISQDEGLGSAVEWMEDQDQYKDAEDYATKHELHNAMIVFPNTLLLDYSIDHSDYQDTEIEIIEKLIDLNRALNRLDVGSFSELSDELKDALNIKDSYNPFMEN